MEIPQETPKAAAAYAIYETMGDERSLSKLRERLGKAKGYDQVLFKWSSTYHWQERVQAFDAAKREHDRRLTEQLADAEKKRKATRDARRNAARERMEDERADIFRSQWVKVLKKINEKIEGADLRGMVGLVTLLGKSLDEEKSSLGAAIQSIAISGNMSVQHEHTFTDDTQTNELIHQLLRRVGANSSDSESSRTSVVGE